MGAACSRSPQPKRGNHQVDRKSGGEGKRVDLGGCRIIKKKRRDRRWNCAWSSDVCSSDLIVERRVDRVNAGGLQQIPPAKTGEPPGRSEERRGGEESRSRWVPYH